MGDPQQVGGALDGPGVGEHVGQQFAVDLVVQVVDGIVIGAYLAGQPFVPAGVGQQALVKHLQREFRHSRNVNQRLDQGLIADADADFGDALGVIAHALQLGGDMYGAQHGPQVGGGRLLGGQQGYALAFEAILQTVDLIVGVDDFLGQIDVLGFERAEGRLGGGFDQAAHFGQVGLQVSQIAVVVGA